MALQRWGREYGRANLRLSILEHAPLKAADGPLEAVAEHWRYALDADALAGEGEWNRLAWAMSGLRPVASDDVSIPFRLYSDKKES